MVIKWNMDYFLNLRHRIPHFQISMSEMTGNVRNVLKYPKMTCLKRLGCPPGAPTRPYR